MHFAAATPGPALFDALDAAVHLWRFRRGTDWRRVLAGYLDRSPGSLGIVRGRHGKPALADDALAFNLSHSGDWGLLALARGCALGVDIERPRLVSRRGSLLARCFSACERTWVGEDDARLLRAWTLKEALVKAHGRGIAYGLSRVVTTLDGDRLKLAEVAGEAGPATRWRVHGFEAAPGHLAALVHDGPARALRAFDFG
jgi:4'-phosphopantetheinyl transferase